MRILLVDNDPFVLNSIKSAVIKACPTGEIISFLIPEQAWQYSLKNVPDIAFLDAEMNGKSGLSLGKSLKKLNPSIRLVFCAGYPEYAIDALKMHASGYLLKPISESDISSEIESMSVPVYIPYKKKKITVKTFGNFDVYVDDKIVQFTRNKSKEILAILVDNCGETVKSEMLADLLWEDGLADRSRKKQLYTIIGTLRKNLQSAGAGEILVKANKGYAVDKTKFDCDYYKLLDGDLSVLNYYNGKYMHEYSWAELTVAKIEKLIKY